MNILLVYSSKTGNTRMVAEAIGEELQVRAVPVEDNPEPASYDLVIAGFWVDRGTADARMKAYLPKLTGQKVALFATLGAEADSPHAVECLDRGAALLGEGCKIVGRFICQGKVAPEMVDMMRKLFPAGHPHAMTPERLARIEKAASHPDTEDLLAARAYFGKLQANLA